MTQELQTAPTELLPTPTPGSTPDSPLPINPAIRFKQVRDELLKWEEKKLNNEEIDLKIVQGLVHEAASLSAALQVGTSGPKKPKVEGEKAEKKSRAAKPKKASSIAHLNIPDGDDF